MSKMVGPRPTQDVLGQVDSWREQRRALNASEEENFPNGPSDELGGIDAWEDSDDEAASLLQELVDAIRRDNKEAY